MAGRHILRALAHHTRVKFMLYAPGPDGTYYVRWFTIAGVVSVYAPVRTVTGRCTQAVASLAGAASVHAPVRASYRLTHYYGVSVRAPVCELRVHGFSSMPARVRASCRLTRHCWVLFVPARYAKRLRHGYGRSRVHACATACKPIASPTIAEVVSVRAPVCEAPPPRLWGGARKVSPRSPLQGSPCMREARATRLRVLRASSCIATITGGKADVARAYGTLRNTRDGPGARQGL
ncbi:hypothetical protein K438DRAFT_1784545 [Mycena galopus ATCC 62051]|nr:hypothetical protein K438DRAFT_1784545 [Mycena galopus ATCC 62051]